MPASTGGNDFFLEFGSNAKQFADDLVNQSNNARTALQELMREAQRVNSAMSRSNAGRAQPLTSLQQQQDKSAKVLADNLNSVVSKMETRFDRMADHFKQQMALAGENLRDSLRDTENRLAAIVKEAKGIGVGPAPKGGAHATGVPVLDDRDKASRNVIDQATRSLDGALTALNNQVVKTRDSARGARGELQLMNNQLDYMAAKFENLTVTMANAQVHVQGTPATGAPAPNVTHHAPTTHAPAAPAAAAPAAPARPTFIPSATAGGAALQAQAQPRVMSGTERVSVQLARQREAAAKREMAALLGNATVEEQRNATLARLEASENELLRQIEERRAAVNRRKGGTRAEKEASMAGLGREEHDIRSGFARAKSIVGDTSNAEAMADITTMGRNITERFQKAFLEKHGVPDAQKLAQLNYTTGGNKSGGQIPLSLNRALGGLTKEQIGQLPQANKSLKEYGKEFSSFARDFVETTLRRAPELPRQAFNQDELLRSVLTKTDQETVAAFTRRQRPQRETYYADKEGNEVARGTAGAKRHTRDVEPPMPTVEEQRRYIGALSRLRERETAGGDIKSSNALRGAAREFLTGRDQTFQGQTGRQVKGNSVLSQEGLDIFESRRGGVSGTTNRDLNRFRDAVRRAAQNFEHLVSTNQIPRLEEMITDVVRRQEKLTTGRDLPNDYAYKFGESSEQDRRNDVARLRGEHVPETAPADSAAIRRNATRVERATRAQEASQQAVTRTTTNRQLAEERLRRAIVQQAIAAQTGYGPKVSAANNEVTAAQSALAKQVRKANEAESRLVQTSLALSRSNEALETFRQLEAQDAQVEQQERRAESGGRKARKGRKGKAADEARPEFADNPQPLKTNPNRREASVDELREQRELSRQYRKLPKKADDTEETAAIRAQINARRAEIRAAQTLAVAETAQAESARQATAANQEATEATTSQAKATKAKRATDAAGDTVAVVANAERSYRNPHDEARATLSSLRKQAKKTPDDAELQASIAAAEQEVERTKADLKAKRAAKAQATKAATAAAAPIPTPVVNAADVQAEIDEGEARKAREREDRETARRAHEIARARAAETKPPVAEGGVNRAQKMARDQLQFGVTEEDGKRTISARPIGADPRTGVVMSNIDLDPKTGEIKSVFTHPEYRRQGIASHVLDYAREQGFNPQHSAERTAEGSAWAAATGGHVPKLAREVPSVVQEVDPQAAEREARFQEQLRRDRERRRAAEAELSQLAQAPLPVPMSERPGAGAGAPTNEAQRELIENGKRLEEKRKQLKALEAEAQRAAEAVPPGDQLGGGATERARRDQAAEAAKAKRAEVQGLAGKINGRPVAEAPKPEPKPEPEKVDLGLEKAKLERLWGAHNDAFQAAWNAPRIDREDDELTQASKRADQSRLQRARNETKKVAQAQAERVKQLEAQHEAQQAAQQASAPPKAPTSHEESLRQQHARGFLTDEELQQELAAKPRDLSGKPVEMMSPTGSFPHAPVRPSTGLRDLNGNPVRNLSDRNRSALTPSIDALRGQHVEAILRAQELQEGANAGGVRGMFGRRGRMEAAMQARMQANMLGRRIQDAEMGRGAISQFGLGPAVGTRRISLTAPQPAQQTGASTIRLTAQNPTITITGSGATRPAGAASTQVPPTQGAPRTQTGGGGSEVPPKPPLGVASAFPPGWEPPAWMNKSFEMGPSKSPGLYANQLQGFSQGTRDQLGQFRAEIEKHKAAGGNPQLENENLIRAAAVFREDPQFKALPNQGARKGTFAEAMGLNEKSGRLLTNMFSIGDKGLLNADPRFNREATGSGRASGSGAGAGATGHLSEMVAELEHFQQRIQAIHPGAGLAQLQAVAQHVQGLIAATTRYNAVVQTGTATQTQLASAMRGVTSASTGLNRAVNVATGGRGIPAAPGPVPGGLGAHAAAAANGGAGAPPPPSPLGGSFGGAGSAGGPPSGLGAAVFGQGGFGRGLLRHAGLALENSIAYKITFEGVEKLHELVNTAIEAQQSFVRLQASLDKLGIPIKSLKQDLVDISSDTATPIQNVTEAAADLVGTLKNVDDLKVGTTIAAQLANVSQGTLSAEEAAKGLRDVVAAYGPEWQKAGKTSTQAIREVGDEIASLSELTGVSIKDITESTTQLAAEAKHFGLTQPQASVLGAEVTRNTGETGEAAAEQVSRIMSTLNNGKLQQLLVQTQVATKAQFQGQDGGLAAVMGQLLEKFEKLSPASQQAIFALAGTGRQARAFTGLMNDSAQITELFNTKIGDTGALSDLNSRYLNTLGGALKKLNEDFENIGARLQQLGAFDAFAVILKGVDLALIGINKFLSLLKSISDSNPLAKFAIEGTLAIATLVAAMAGLRALWGATIGRFGGLGGRGAAAGGGAAGAAGGAGAAGAARQGLFSRVFGGASAAPTNVNATGGGANAGTTGASNSRSGYGGIFRPPAAAVTNQGNLAHGPGSQAGGTPRSARVSFNPLRPQFAQSVIGAVPQVVGRGISTVGSGVENRLGQGASAASRAMGSLGRGMQTAGAATIGFGSRIQTFAAQARLGQNAMTLLGAGLTAFMLVLPFLIESVMKTNDIAKRGNEAFNSTFGYGQKEDPKSSANLGQDKLDAGAQAAKDARDNYSFGDAITDTVSDLTGGLFGGTQRQSAGMTSEKFDKGSDALFKSGIDKLKASKGDKEATQKALSDIDQEYKDQADGLVKTAGDKAAQAEAQHQLEVARALLQETGTKRIEAMNGIKEVDQLNETQMAAIGTFVQQVSGLNRNTLAQSQRLSAILAAQTLVDANGQDAKFEATAIDPNATDFERRAANIKLLQDSLAANEAYLDSPVVKDLLTKNPNDPTVAAHIQAMTQQQQALQQLQTQQFTIPAQVLQSSEGLYEKAGDSRSAIDDLNRANDIWQSYADTLSHDSPEYIAALQAIQDNKVKIATLQATPELNKLSIAQSATADPVTKARIGSQIARLNVSTANTAAAKIQADAYRKRVDDDNADLKTATSAAAVPDKIMAEQRKENPLTAFGVGVYPAGIGAPETDTSPTHVDQSPVRAAAQKKLAAAQKRVADDKANKGKKAELTPEQKETRIAMNVANIAEADANEQQKQATAAAQNATIRNSTANIQARGLELQRQYLTYSQGQLKDDTKAAQILAQMVSLSQEGMDNAEAILQARTQSAATVLTARGDSVGAAQKLAEGAAEAYQYALAQFGADDPKTIAAYGTMVQTARSQFDAGMAKIQAKSDLGATRSDVTGHTVEAAKKRAETAQQNYQTYLRLFGADSDDTIRAQATALTTARAAFDAEMTHIAAKSDLEATELETAGAAQGGDPVKAAQKRADTAMQQYKTYLAIFGADSDDTIKAKANALQLARSAFDTQLNTQLEVLDFQKETYQITSTQEIASLQQILKNKNLTLEEQRTIILKIKSLQESIRQQLTQGGMNIPSDIKLPTAYQIRRSLSSGDQVGSTNAIVNNTRSTNNVTITNQGISQSDMQKITQAVVAAVSTGTNQAVRANTATPSLVNRGG